MEMVWKGSALILILVVLGMTVVATYMAITQMKSRLTLLVWPLAFVTFLLCIGLLLELLGSMF